MALSFPLTRAEFFAGLRVRSARFWLPLEQSIMRTAGGEVPRARLGNGLWMGRARLASQLPADGRAADAVIEMLGQTLGTFLADDPSYRGPREDQGGTKLGSAQVQIGTVAANNRDLSLTGLPAGYVLCRGDMLSFIYGSNPPRYAMHRVVTDRKPASGAGNLTIEVTPHIEPGWTAGTVVQLKDPLCKVVLTGFDEGEDDLVTRDGMSLTFVQTLS